jgi:hypothetical protein
LPNNAVRDVRTAIFCIKWARFDLFLEPNRPTLLNFVNGSLHEQPFLVVGR